MVSSQFKNVEAPQDAVIAIGDPDQLASVQLELYWLKRAMKTTRRCACYYDIS